MSVEDRRRADERIPLLLETPASIRFISAEPLLGPVDLTSYLRNWSVYDPALGTIGWVIAGAESGPNRRPFDLDWARDLRDQCLAAGVPYFYKQSSALRPGQGAELDGVEWRQFPNE